jgi:hypothetical protein
MLQGAWRVLWGAGLDYAAQPEQSKNIYQEYLSPAAPSAAAADGG